MDSDLCYMSATEAMQLFRARALSPVELMRATIARAEAVDPIINAFGDTYFEQAMAAAKGAERDWMSCGDRRGPLCGIPLGVKDNQRVKGQRNTFGSPAFRDNVADRSDPMIARLEEAGAIIHGRTTVSEFCMSGVCRSPMWGTTRNPWNPEFSPGGSSGGSGAALAAGTTIVATGTDVGGSIRVPASACGVVGYKPPHGRNPDGSPFNLDPFNHCGPLARSVADIALMQNITSGPHLHDHDSLRERVDIPVNPSSIKGLRVGWSLDLGYRVIDPEVRNNTLEAIEVFRSLGCHTEEVDTGWTEELDSAFLHWFNTMHSGRMIAECAKTHPELLSDDLTRFAREMGHTTSVEDIPAVFDMIQRMVLGFAPIMERCDVFVCPTMAVPAVNAEQPMWDSVITVDGTDINPEFGYSMTHQFNMLHNCPVMSVPSGFSNSGIPTGIQIVGRTFDDVGVFRAALAFEEAVGGWLHPAVRPALAS